MRIENLSNRESNKKQKILKNRKMIWYRRTRERLWKTKGFFKRQVYQNRNQVRRAIVAVIADLKTFIFKLKKYILRN